MSFIMCKYLSLFLINSQGSQAILIEFLITNCYQIFVDDEVEDQENDNQMIVLHHNESFKRKHNNKTWKFWSSPTRYAI